MLPGRAAVRRLVDAAGRRRRCSARCSRPCPRRPRRGCRARAPCRRWRPPPPCRRAASRWCRRSWSSTLRPRRSPRRRSRGLPGTPSTSATRPPMLAGPMLRHSRPARGEGGAAVAATASCLGRENARGAGRPGGRPPTRRRGAAFAGRRGRRRRATRRMEGPLLNENELSSSRKAEGKATNGTRHAPAPRHSQGAGDDRPSPLAPRGPGRGPPPRARPGHGHRLPQPQGHGAEGEIVAVDLPGRSAPATSPRARTTTTISVAAAATACSRSRAAVPPRWAGRRAASWRSRTRWSGTGDAPPAPARPEPPAAHAARPRAASRRPRHRPPGRPGRVRAPSEPRRRRLPSRPPSFRSTTSCGGWPDRRPRWPSSCPPGRMDHAFEPRPQDLVRLARVELAFGVGLGLDPWLRRVLAAATDGRARVVEIGPGPRSATDSGARLALVEGEPVAEAGRTRRLRRVVPGARPGPLDPHVLLDPRPHGPGGHAHRGGPGRPRRPGGRRATGRARCEVREQLEALDAELRARVAGLEAARPS